MHRSTPLLVKRVLAHPGRILWRALLTALLGSLTACQQAKPTLRAEEPELATYLELILPARIELQKYLTKPVSYAGDGSADGLEVILAAYDASGEPTKVVGTFHFELQAQKNTESIGARVAFWPVAIDTAQAMRMYRDPLSRYYQFPLLLEQKPLPPGTYLLSVWLHLPGGRRLFDEYEFSYDGAGAPPVRPL